MKWVTRERPKVDRIACPWLITRFVDADAVFLYAPAIRCRMWLNAKVPRRMTSLAPSSATTERSTPADGTVNPSRRDATSTRTLGGCRHAAVPVVADARRE